MAVQTVERTATRAAEQEREAVELEVGKHLRQGAARESAGAGIRLRHRIFPARSVGLMRAPS